MYVHMLINHHVFVATRSKKALSDLQRAMTYSAVSGSSVSSDLVLVSWAVGGGKLVILVYSDTDFKGVSGSAGDSRPYRTSFL
jgi:hypothetical protein